MASSDTLASADVRTSLDLSAPEPYSLVRLPDGRALSYLEVGVPSGPAVFHFHGHGSSRLEALMLEEQALKLGVRVIAFDRPGIGRSDPKSGDMLLDWPARHRRCRGPSRHRPLCRAGHVGRRTLCSRLRPSHVRTDYRLLAGKRSATAGDRPAVGPETEAFCLVGGASISELSAPPAGTIPP